MDTPTASALTRTTSRTVQQVAQSPDLECAPPIALADAWVDVGLPVK